jgi:hypothetical protein
MRGFFTRFEIIGEFLKFLWSHKLYWLILVAIILFLFAIIIILANVPGLSPFIYPFV